MKRFDIAFQSGKETCKGWLYRPEDDTAKAPCVVMANGVSLTRHSGLTAYAEALAEAGAAVLVDDYRHLGDSDGQPRQHIRSSRLATDCRAAVAYASRLDGVDAQKIVLWGYSLSAGTAVAVAATDTRVAGMILMCPFLDGLSRMMATIRHDPANMAWLLPRVIKDSLGSRTLVPVTAQPGERAAMTLPGEADGFASATAGSQWVNLMSPGFFATAPFFRPVTKAKKLACPILVQSGERDTTVPSRAVERLAQAAPRAQLKRYDVDHFQPLYNETREAMAADQAEWLRHTILSTSPGQAWNGRSLRCSVRPSEERIRQ